jgi:hypothetical protein
MELKNAVKKIVALGVGATMLGATILGATAAKLADYPSPFVVDGKFDGLMVVGDTAKTVDNIGMTEVFGSLQYANRKDFGTAVTSNAVTSISSGKKLEKSGDHLNWGDYLYDMQDTPMDSGDLPVLLKDGTFEDNEGANKVEETYTQELNVFDLNSQYLFGADENNDDLAGSYVYLTDGDIIDYMLEFDTPIPYEDNGDYAMSDDLESTKLEILGQMYTITDVSFDSSDEIDKITLLSGDVVVWLTQDVKITRVIDGVEHVIQVVDVSENEDRCGVNVDGTTAWIDVDSTEKINGVEIGVTDAVSVHTATQDTDVCELSVGASELVLEQGQEVEVGGVAVEGSDVAFDSDGTEWTSMTITVSNEDEMWLKPGAKWVEQVFNSVKIDFANEVYNNEDIKYSSSGDKASLEFLNADNDMVKIEWRIDDSDNIFLGTDTDKDFMFTGYDEGDTKDCDTTSTSYDDCEGTKLLVVTSGEVPHVIEITNIDSTNEEVSFKDLTSGSTFSEKDFTMGSSSDIALGSLGTIDLTINSAGTLVIGDIQLGENPQTKYGATLDVDAYGLVDSFTIIEEDDDDNNYEWYFPFSFDSSDDIIEVSPSDVVLTDIGSEADWTTGPIDTSGSDDGDTWFASEWGTTVKMDNDQPYQTMNMYYPDEARYGNVFIAPTSAEVSTVAGGSGDVVRIDVGASILASEIPGQLSDHNLLLVGGPCVNSAAAELLGNPDPCYKDFEEGKAMIKLFENGENVALLVAGYSGTDTRAAARYLANYDKHQDVFSKATTEISLSVTSIDKVQASVPTSE